MASIEEPIGEHDVVELLEAVEGVEAAGEWPAGTIGTVVSEHGEWKLVEIAEDRPPGAMLDMVSVAEARLKLVAKHSRQLDDADPDGARITEILDSIPGAWERAQEGLEQARRGEGIPLEEL